MDLLFQRYFKSTGARTYAAQVMRAGNGNHGLVLTEGKRDKTTNEVRKHRLYIWSEDFDAFFQMVSEMADWIRDHPAPPRKPRSVAAAKVNPAARPSSRTP